jgi:hypothetical protein
MKNWITKKDYILPDTGDSNAPVSKYNDNIDAYITAHRDWAIRPLRWNTFPDTAPPNWNQTRAPLTIGFYFNYFGVTCYFELLRPNRIIPWHWSADDFYRGPISPIQYERQVRYHILNRPEYTVSFKQTYMTAIKKHPAERYKTIIRVQAQRVKMNELMIRRTCELCIAHPYIDTTLTRTDLEIRAMLLYQFCHDYEMCPSQKDGFAYKAVTSIGGQKASVILSEPLLNH